MSVVFVIPYKARATSANWEADCALLQNTLGAIDCQDSKNHQSIVVCNEIPSLSRSFERVEFVSTERTITGTLNQESAKADKVAKALLGLRHAERYSPRYAMIVDADDLLHRSIVSYIESKPDYDAFLITLGYLHRLGDDWMRQTRSFHRACASSIVYPFHSSWLDAGPDSESVYARIVTHHNQLIERDFEALGVKFQRVPFFGAVYTQGVEGNMRAMESPTAKKERPADAHFVSRHIRKLRVIRARFVEELVRWMLGHQPIDATIRSEFPTLCANLALRSHQATSHRDEECSSEGSNTSFDPIKITIARSLWLSIRRRVGPEAHSD